MEQVTIHGECVRHKKPLKPIRLPRKLKKDIIKTSGRDAYWQIMGYIHLQVMMGGPQYIKIRKRND